MGLGQWIAFLVSMLLMLIGIAGTIVPVLPGLPLVWGTMWIFGFFDKFQRVDAAFLTVTLGIVVAAEVADYAARAWGARRFGASRAGTWGTVLGAVAGLFFLPIGLVLGPFFGAFIAELLVGRTTDESIRAGWGGVVGTLGSVVIKIAVGVGMAVAFAGKVL